MLPSWDPTRLTRKIPFVLGLVGGRRQGKSTAVADLLSRMSNQFDLVICMVGSAACNPVLEALLHEHWDDRFFFPEWDNAMMAKLLKQQEFFRKIKYFKAFLRNLLKNPLLPQHMGLKSDKSYPPRNTAAYISRVSPILVRLARRPCCLPSSSATATV